VENIPARHCSQLTSLEAPTDKPRHRIDDKNVNDAMTENSVAIQAFTSVLKRKNREGY